MQIPATALQALIQRLFNTAGCGEGEAREIARCLVRANLVGHDSHGVIRAPTYIGWIRDGLVTTNQEAQVVLDEGPIGLLDGQFGFGQVMARAAVERTITKTREHGVGVVGLRNAAHVGRVGDWVELAAEAGLISLCFVNTTGRGMLTAPYGGIDRRLSANPIAAAVPIKGSPPLVLDISCSAIAEGKIKVALNRGEAVPAGTIIDSEGGPTTSPEVFYADPCGAILPFGGHKGFGLGMLVELLAGALTGGGCTRPGRQRLEQGMLMIGVDIERFQPEDAFAAEAQRFIEFVRSSRTVSPEGEILMPGEPERRVCEQRLENGIELDDTTLSQLRDCCAEVGVDVGPLLSPD